MGRSRIFVVSAVAALVVSSACDADDATDTSVTPTTPPAVTTTVPPTTTTSEPGPCPDDPFCVVYEVRPEAAWSDGEPVTWEDFAHTAEVMADPDTATGDGHSLITSVTPLGEKTVVVGLSEVFPAWRTLFDMLLPAHHEGPLDAPGAPVTGPFALREWVGGDRITLARNPLYWSPVDALSGAPTGDVQEIVFVFPGGAREQLQGLERGDVELIFPRPLDWMVGEVDGMDEVSYRLAPGPFWDHIDFNHDDELLSQSWARRAISLAIDRERVLDETVRTVDPDAQALDSAIWMQSAPYYRDDYRHVFHPEAAEQVLIEEGCERGDGGVYECQGRRMSFTWATTVGDEYRDTVFDLVRDDLARVGIEVTLDSRTPSDLFSREVFFAGPEVWQIINFSWKAEPDPYLGNSTFYCEGAAPSGYGELNVNRYCDEEVASLIRETETIIDPDRRAAVYNEADRLYLDDRAIIPLFQRPILVAWRDVLTGVEPNVSDTGHLWNAGAWRGDDSVVVALESEPGSLSPTAPESDVAETVLATMFHGAFGVDASLRYVPVLVSSATPVHGEG